MFDLEVKWHLHPLFSFPHAHYRFQALSVQCEQRNKYSFMFTSAPINSTGRSQYRIWYERYSHTVLRRWCRKPKQRTRDSLISIMFLVGKRNKPWNKSFKITGTQSYKRMETLVIVHRIEQPLQVLFKYRTPYSGWLNGAGDVKHLSETTSEIMRFIITTFAKNGLAWNGCNRRLPRVAGSHREYLRGVGFESVQAFHSVSTSLVLLPVDDLQSVESE